MITLYDLVFQEDRRPSPFVWRTKFALMHKALKWAEVPMGFTEKDKIAFANAQTVPVIKDGEDERGGDEEPFRAMAGFGGAPCGEGAEDAEWEDVRGAVEETGEEAGVGDGLGDTGLAFEDEGGFAGEGVAERVGVGDESEVDEGGDGDEGADGEGDAWGRSMIAPMYLAERARAAAVPRRRAARGPGFCSQRCMAAKTAHTPKRRAASSLK